MKYFILLLVLSCGCQSTPIQQKRDHIIECVKDLHNNDIGESEAFEACRQIYGLELKK